MMESERMGERSRTLHKKHDVTGKLCTVCNFYNSPSVRGQMRTV